MVIECVEVLGQKPIEGDIQVAIPLSHITQKPTKGPGLDVLQLFLHPIDIGRELELGVVRKMNVISGIDASQVEVIFHALTEGSVGGSIDLG